MLDASAERMQLYPKELLHYCRRLGRRLLVLNQQKVEEIMKQTNTNLSWTV